MEKKELTCIGCPLGCQITVTLENDSIVSVAGNTCPRGETYARKEVTAPERVVTSTVTVLGSSLDTCLPVKTDGTIPKGKIFSCMQALKGITVKAPVRTGDVIIENVCGTGVDVIATKTVEQNL